MKNLLELTDEDLTRIRRYALPKVSSQHPRASLINPSAHKPTRSSGSAGKDDQVALVRRIREKQKSDDLIASNGRMVSAARKTSDHTDLAQLHAQAVRDKGDGALAELGDFACQLHTADPTACQRWKTAMKRELPGEMKRLEAAVQHIEAEEMKAKRPSAPSAPDAWPVSRVTSAPKNTPHQPNETAADGRAKGRLINRTGITGHPNVGDITVAEVRRIAEEFGSPEETSWLIRKLLYPLIRKQSREELTIGRGLPRTVGGRKG